MKIPRDFARVISCGNRWSNMINVIFTCGFFHMFMFFTCSRFTYTLISYALRTWFPCVAHVVHVCSHVKRPHAFQFYTTHMYKHAESNHLQKNMFTGRLRDKLWEAMPFYWKYLSVWLQFASIPFWRASACEGENWCPYFSIKACFRLGETSFNFSSFNRWKYLVPLGILGRMLEDLWIWNKDSTQNMFWTSGRERWTLSWKQNRNNALSKN